MKKSFPQELFLLKYKTEKRYFLFKNWIYSACNEQCDFQHIVKLKLSLCMPEGYIMGVEV